MSKYIILISIVAISCISKEIPDFPVLEINPIEAAYSKNGITSYVELDYFNGDTLILDTVFLNNDGRTLSRVGHAGWRSETYFEYDSIGRLIETRHHSDIRYNLFISYDFQPAQYKVIETWYEIFSNDTTLFEKNIYEFDEELKYLASKTRMHDSKIYSITSYEYIDGMIKQIKETGEVNRVINYIYSNGILNQVQTYHDNDLFYLHFISPSTGLIDSTLCPPKKQTIFYVYN